MGAQLEGLGPPLVDGPQALGVVHQHDAVVDYHARQQHRADRAQEVLLTGAWLAEVVMLLARVNFGTFPNLVPPLGRRGCPFSSVFRPALAVLLLESAKKWHPAALRNPSAGCGRQAPGRDPKGRKRPEQEPQRELADELDPFVRDRYLELWSAAQHAPDE